MAGGVASQAVALFDRYWSNRRVRPVEHVAGLPWLDGGLDELRRTLDGAATSASAPAYLQRVRALPDLAGLLAERPIQLDADKVRVMADPPRKGA